MGLSRLHVGFAKLRSVGFLSSNKGQEWGDSDYIFLVKTE